MEDDELADDEGILIELLLKTIDEAVEVDIPLPVDDEGKLDVAVLELELIELGSKLLRGSPASLMGGVLLAVG